MAIVLKYSQRHGERGEIEFDAEGLESIRVSYPFADVVTFCDASRMVSFRDLIFWELNAEVSKSKKGKDSLTVVLDEDDVKILKLALGGLDVSESLRRSHQALLRILEKFQEGS